MRFGRSQTRLPSRRTTSVTALVACALWLVMSGTASAGEARTIGILDRCDPESFNAAVEPGTCVGRNGGVHFDTFLERVNPKDGGHSAWRFSPGQVRLRPGQFLRAENRGGEVHTFTEVVNFGAGFVDELNAALPPDTPPAVPVAPPPEFIPAGAQVELGPLDPGTHLFECLIHPWMRTTVEQT